MQTVKFNKDAARSVTNRFVADMTGIIYNGLVHNVPKNRTLRTLRNEIGWYSNKMGGISLLSQHRLWLSAVKSYQETAKTAYSSLRKTKSSINYQESLKKRSEGVFEALNKKVIETAELAKAGNFVLNEKEFNTKAQNLTQMFDESRESEAYSPFYLSDSHANCAKDHLAYESRVYYDEKYEQFVTDESELAKIKAYIHNHKCMSVQAVVGAPVWFTTRPNCKHRLVPVPVAEVLGSSIRKMQIKRKLIVKSVPISNAETMSRAYFKKLLDYKALWDIMPNDQLATRMKQTKMLYKKWARLARH